MREKNKARRRNGPIGPTENEKDGARKGKRTKLKTRITTEEEGLNVGPKYDEEKHRRSERRYERMNQG